MSTHGSTKYRRNQVRYAPKHLKVINAMWQELLGEPFRPHPRKQLDQLVMGEVGSGRYESATQLVKANLKDKTVYYWSPARRPFEIPKKLRPLIMLALVKRDYSYSISNRDAYIPARV